ncbi:hypothetical protein PILCRDRAFT_7291 [Piloderma croceum F 1598]|uniref:Uncharacterized protein n=1 Tax=Piloderma croceum (strain F 1598) TaxID=765440 RepID=A0A0C3FG29_PILCF|nr:hypothetical protein PILCRDRAFT_7291 [Piloderma croceum F 1598]
MATVNLRIVNAMNGMTLCDDNVDDVKYGKVESKGGDPHECDGTNNNENPFPGPTCTNALHKGTNGNWVGVYYPNMEDFLIKEILDVRAGDNTYWSIWLNYKYVTVGGCQAQIKNHDSVLHQEKS